MTDIELNICGCWDDRLRIVVHLIDEYGFDRPSTMDCEETVSQMEGTPNYGKDDEAVSFERPLTQDEADRVTSAMSGFLVPAIPDAVVGCDGHNVTLEIRRGFNTSSYSWWASPP